MKRKSALTFCLLFLFSQFLFSQTKLSVQRQSFITSCLELQGVPYVWGGESPEGFDCSGFVMYVGRKGVPFDEKSSRRLVISLPRNSNQMFLRTVPIKKSEREPGDLVFFKDNMNEERITHVGVYCGVYRGPIKEYNGKRVFISALSAGENTGIQLRPIDTPYWEKRLYSYGRIFVSSKQYEEGYRIIKKSSSQ